MTHTKQCEVCGKNFEKKINYSKKYWAKAKFCSRECQIKGRVYTGERGGFKKGIVPWNKGMKGVNFNTGRTHFKKGEHPSPKIEFKKGNIPWSKGKKLLYATGENNPNWKGRITSEHQKLRHSPEMKELRAKTFKRDKYSCKLCGRKRIPGDRVILEIHHIKPFATHKELRFNEDNVITLCAECHRKTETYGKNV